MNNAAQLKAVIKNIARDKNIGHQVLLTNYMMERLLERISLSRYRKNFILKGGMLIAALVGLHTRATVDMDTTIKGYPLTHDSVVNAFEEIAAIHIADGVAFTTNLVRFLCGLIPKS